MLKVVSESLRDANESYFLVSQHMTLNQFKRCYSPLLMMNADRMGFSLQKQRKGQIIQEKISHEEVMSQKLLYLGLLDFGKCVKIEEDVGFDEGAVASYPPRAGTNNYQP